MNTSFAPLRLHVPLAIRMAVGCVFIWAAISKLENLDAWSKTLPAAIVSGHAAAFAVAIVSAELTFGAVLFMERFTLAASLAAMALLAVFSVYLLVKIANPQWGLPGGCSCFGLAAPSSDNALAAWLPVVRNAAMIAALAWSARGQRVPAA